MSIVAALEELKAKDEWDDNDVAKVALGTLYSVGLKEALGICNNVACGYEKIGKLREAAAVHEAMRKIQAVLENKPEETDLFLACASGFAVAARDIREGKARIDPESAPDLRIDDPELLFAFKVGYEEACIAYRLGNDPTAMAEAEQFQVDPKMVHEVIGELLDGARHTRLDPREPVRR